MAGPQKLARRRGNRPPKRKANIVCGVSKTEVIAAGSAVKREPRIDLGGLLALHAERHELKRALQGLIAAVDMLTEVIELDLSKLLREELRDRSVQQPNLFS
jgi:hypothetical protein